MNKPNKIVRTGTFLFMSGLLAFLATGCKKAVDAVDNASSEAIGYRAVKQSEGVEAKVKAAEAMEMERAKNINDQINEANK